MLSAVAIVAACAISLLSGASKTVSLRNGDETIADNTPKIALAYVESGIKTLPEPDIFTHLVYAFAEFNDACDGLEIATPTTLKGMSQLKSINPELKVILGVGGYKRKGFSEMARDKKKRRAFVREVKAVIDSLGLDGVDLDWEFPTTENGGHTASPKDARNYVTLVKDLRKALGKDKWISFYSHNTGLYIDLKRMVPYVDYVHVSGYNLSVPQEDKRPAYHQSPLYPSAKLGDWCVKKVAERHIELGVPKEKMLIGIPFFGRGLAPFPSYAGCRQFDKYSKGLDIIWDDEARAPYYAGTDGDLLLGFDDERSIEEKMKFVRANEMPGIFVWNYGSDYPDHRLGHAIERLRK